MEDFIGEFLIQEVLAGLEQKVFWVVGFGYLVDEIKAFEEFAFLMVELRCL